MIVRASLLALVVVTAVTQPRKVTSHSTALGSPPAACGPSRLYDPDLARERYEPACLAALGLIAKRSGATLTLSLANGKTKTFTSESALPNSSPPEWKTSFRLVAYDPAAFAFIVSGPMHKMIGVDSRDGHETDLGTDFPHYAPGGAFALSISGETDAVAIRDTSVNPAKVVWEHRPKHRLNQKFIAWDGDQRARLLVEDNLTAFIVRDQAGEWTYDTIPMDEPVVEEPPTCMPDPAGKDQNLWPCLEKLDGMVIDNGTLLSLRLEDGSRKRLLGDKAENSSYLDYQLVGFDPRFHAYVVAVYYYEGGGMAIIDSRTGEMTYLGDNASAPYSSPDGKLFVVTSTNENDSNVRIFAWGQKPSVIWSSGNLEGSYYDIHVLGWGDDRRVGLRLQDGGKATVSKDDKGAWHFDKTGTP